MCLLIKWKELLVTMKGIQHLMDRSSTPCSSSSKYSSKSGSSTASKRFMYKLPVISKVDNQAVQLPSVWSTSQSSSCPPEVRLNSVALSSAMPHLPNLSILDAAVPSVGLPRPILSSPATHPAAPVGGNSQNPSVYPLNSPVVNTAQPLVSFSPQQKQCSPSMPQSVTFYSHHEQTLGTPCWQNICLQA